MRPTRVQQLQYSMLISFINKHYMQKNKEFIKNEIYRNKLQIKRFLSIRY